MRKIFLPLTVILFFFICASANAQIGGFCNASAGSVAITSSTGNGCPGNNSTLLTRSGTFVGSIQWVYSLDGISWVEIDGETGTSYTADDLNVTTRYAVRATFTGISGTCSELSNVVVITIATPVWYKDVDDDDYSDGTILTQCTHPGANYKSASQLTATSGDCNDNNPSVHPGASEVFDGVDNNCDGAVDEGFHDYIIPAGISSISLTVQGAKGGSIKRQDVHLGQPIGSPVTVATGGGGARLNAKFKIETDCQQGLKRGGKLRMIIGATPNAIIRNQQVPSLPVPPTSFGQGGGGGTAILYQAPGTSSWVVLAVAGGGGGAFSRADGLNSLNSNGIAAIQQSFNATTTGSDGMGGAGFFITQEIPDGDPRDGGLIVTSNISGGGGGAFGDATQNCGGKKGMEEGGTSTVCLNGNAGGYGFGAGGSGISRSDNESTPLSEEGGGGGGGGYSGGNGGENATGGFGGGSYVSDLAFESSWLTSSSADDGSISIVTSPIDNADCCDAEALTFTGSYADVNLGCNPANPDGSLGTATATDASSSASITSTDGPIISDGCNRSKTRTFTATDGCSNTITTSRTVRWIADLTPPAFSGSYTDVNLGCNPANPDGSLGTASATDVCGAVTITQSDGAVVSNGCNRSRTRTFTATDGCLNRATTSRTVRWIEDVTAPGFTGSYIDIDLGCNPADPNGSLGSASATDACGAVTITQSDGAVVSEGCNRSRTRTFTAIDLCSNTSVASRTITWKVDITPPRITCPANVELSCNTAIPEPNVPSVTVSDDCPGTIIVSFVSDIVNTVNCSETTTRTYRATDACGNTATCTQTITRKTDTSPPTITCPANLSLGCRAEIPAPNTGSVTVGDGCPGVITVQHVSTILEDISNCGETWIRRYKATDACGNTAICTQTITRKVDALPPTITCPANLSLGCGAEIPAPNTESVTVSDGCPGEITVQHVSTILQGTSNCVETWIRRYKATDECGNTASCSQTITRIVDINPPIFTNSYADVNLYCNPANPDGSLGTATATDVCGAVTITSSDGAVVSNGCNRSRTRTFTATDGCLNTSTTSRTVRWIFDDTPPEFTGSYADINLGCNPAYPEGALGTATATDACGEVTITSAGLGTIYDGCNRSISRRFFARDKCGNQSFITRTVRWIVELSPPTFTGSYADVNLYCNPANPDGSLGTATATDVCGAVTITSSDGAVQSNGCNRSRTRTFTATDGCLNTSTTSRTVRWIYDVTAPTLTCAKTGTVTKSTNAGLCTYAVDGIEFNPTASDICSTPSLAWSVSGATATDGSGSMNGTQLNFGINTIKWTATDGCGNTSTCSFIVNVNKVTTIPLLVVSTTPVSNPVTQQYSDKITCVATVTPANCPGAGPIGGTVTFKIINAQGTVVLGSAPVASDGTATLTDTLIENQLYPGATNLLPTNGPLKPGNKTVTAVYSDTDPDYIVTNPTAPLVVTCEDAEVTYNGLSYFGANPSTNQGTVTVSAFVLDTNDVNDVPAQARGDIRNATVTFKEATSGGTTIGTANIPVGLVNPNNFQEGIVTTSKNYTLSTQDISCGGKIIEVWAGVNNYYCGEIAEVVPVCLSLPGGDYVTGGGWIKMQNSAGSYAGTADKKMHAALVFKWNKSNKNLQGNATIIYKRVVNGVQKIYQVKSNSIQSMIVNNVNDAGVAVTTGATYRMAQIVTKANFRDVTDPDLPITLLGNLTLTITAWESISITNGSQDRISVELTGTGSQGLIFSSNWLNGGTKWQQIGGGKMQVRNPSAQIPCTNCSGSGITAKTGEEDKTTEIIPATDDLKVTVMPNPSSTNFRIVVNSNDLKAPVKLLITDMLGRVIETRITNAGQTITIGDKYISGTYAVRIIQGRKTKQLSMIKLSD